MTPNRAVTVLLICAAGLNAQRLTYDAARDKTAQDAVAVAKDVTSGALFAKLLRNVDLQAKYEADTTFAFAEQRMRAKLQNFNVWHNAGDEPTTVLPGGMGVKKGSCFSLTCELGALQFGINRFLTSPQLMNKDQVEARLRELRIKKTALENALKELRSSAENDPAVVQTFSWLNDGKNTLDYADKIKELIDGNKAPIKGLSEAFNQIGEGLDQLLGLYNAVNDIWIGQHAIEKEPISLRPPQQQVDLQLLALEADHLQTIARIESRKSIELGVTLGHIEAALKELAYLGLLNSTATVESTLRDAAVAHDRDRLTRVLDALHEAAAAVAEEDAAGALAELRLSDEERRYSIRRSAVNSATYDETIQLASQRLALYWKSGIKPTELAQLIFYLTNTVAVPAIALK